MTTSTHRRTHVFGLLAASCLALLALGVLTDSGPMLLGGDTAHAVVGRPLTPLSYAGVARRTTRRAVYAGAAMHHDTVVVATPPPVVVTPAPVVVTPPPPPPVLTALPANCVRVVTNDVLRYQCGAVWYAPQYSGPNLVYVPVTP